mmetsp:Transcript_28597/g.77032  ORF Transcript_28597/g.77032 Transcript_28597/m.77032 type:complete len:215 (+) Transcript_28597:454-1098(+)
MSTAPRARASPWPGARRAHPGGPPCRCRPRRTRRLRSSCLRLRSRRRCPCLQTRIGRRSCHRPRCCRLRRTCGLSRPRSTRNRRTCCDGVREGRSARWCRSPRRYHHRPRAAWSADWRRCRQRRPPPRQRLRGRPWRGARGGHRRRAGTSGACSARAGLRPWSDRPPPWRRRVARAPRGLGAVPWRCRGRGRRQIARQMRRPAAWGAQAQRGAR